MPIIIMSCDLLIVAAELIKSLRCCMHGRISWLDLPGPVQSRLVLMAPVRRYPVSRSSPTGVIGVGLGRVAGILKGKEDRR